MAPAGRRLLVTTAVALIAAPSAIAGPEAKSAGPTQLPEFFVPGQRIAPIEVPVPRGDLRPPEPNLGAELLAIPGVYAHARASDAMEPNLRGLGFDRVATTIDGVPLVNASPERTNSPVVMLGGSAVRGMRIVKVLPSVTLGPAVTGGRIALTTDANAGTSITNGGVVRATYDGARQGWSTSGRITAAAAGFDATVTGFRDDLFDYRAADGRRVPARFDDHGESAAIGWTSGTQRVHVTVIHRRLRRQETVSLPLDGKNTDATVATFNYRWSNAGAGRWQRTEVRGGYSDTDPYITSEDRVSPRTTAQANARTLGGGISVHLAPTETTRWHIGADASAQRRRAVRTTPAGQDFIWPGVHYDDAGVFAEVDQRLAGGGKLRIGARIDAVRSDADDAARPALGQPIRRQYVTYNGSAAATTDRRDVVGAANVVLETARSRPWSVFAGAGYSEQTAQVMERYRAFLNALGGDGHGGNAVELGNPALRPERKSAVEAGATFRSDRVDAEASVYWYRVDDFIIRTPVGTTVPPAAPAVVFGYRNTDAELHGAELGGTWKLSSTWSVPLTFAIAEGRNERTGKGLAEIPPWELAAALRGECRRSLWPIAIESGVRLVGSRENPAPEESPLFAHTGGFAVWHARGGVALGRSVRVEAGIENVFDRAYTEYLIPPVAPVRPASGDLRPGERVPAPGRSWWISVSKQW